MNCSHCIYANKEKMKCFPESQDCKAEYDCDFFEERRD